MTVKEFILAFKEGNVNILGSHNHQEHYLRDMYSHVDYFSSPENIDKISTRMLDRKLKTGQNIGTGGSYTICRECGETIFLIYMDDNTAYFSPEEQFKQQINSGKGYITPEEIITCVYTSKENNILVSEIDVPTGILVFQNFFKDDNEPDEYNGLSTTKGRQNIMNYYAEQNIGFGLIQNFGAEVYTNKDGQIYIMSRDTEDLDEDLKYLDKNVDKERLIEVLATREKTITEKWTHTGSLHTDVCRWMCKVGTVDSKAKQGRAIVRVEPGRYRIEHYFNPPHNEPDITTKIYKIKGL